GVSGNLGKPRDWNAAHGSAKPGFASTCREPTYTTLQTSGQAIEGWPLRQIKPAFVSTYPEPTYATVGTSGLAIESCPLRQIKELPREWQFPETRRSNCPSKGHTGCSASTNRSKHLRSSLYRPNQYATLLIPICFHFQVSTKM